MKLKLDGEGHAVLQDGKPVYVHDDGKEVPFDAAHTVSTIARLNSEAKGHREAKEALEGQVKAFAGLDPEKAKKALETVSNLDAGKLVDAAAVERVKAEAIKAVEERFAAAAKAHSEELAKVTGERDSIKGQFHNELIGGAFTRSKLIADKITIPADLMQSRFGQNFKMDGGKLVATDNAGNPIYSKQKPGELADFEEALELLVDAYPQRDHILKAAGGGSGSRQGDGKGGAGTKTIKRSDYEAMDMVERGKKVREGYKVVDAA
jgi:hypothetical protein